MMPNPSVCAAAGLLLACGAAWAAAPVQVNPPYPRIANCYGAGLGWRSWEQGAEYWSKLDLFIGGSYDLHYDWDNARWDGVLKAVEENVARLREANPTALVLPYVDVIEGPDNPAVPERWWDLREGERWSGWPGYYRINMNLPEVLQFNLDKVRQEVLGRDFFDGVFYDCWHPDPWLVPRTAALREGQVVVMLNDWNLPAEGFESLNGCLAEDELNRVIEGKVDFEDFLGRYLRWCLESRRPVVTTIVCHPRGIDMDAWRWAKVSWRERQGLRQAFERSDMQTMRFGLATTLMGDGYFAYDCGNMGRGDWWWYPEYDAPLGRPKGPASRRADGTWQREYDGGLVVVNGTSYDAVVELDATHRDVSTGRVRTRFTLPMFDGRILLPTDAPATPGEDVAPRLTIGPPQMLRVVKLDDGVTVVQCPGGLELRFEQTGALRDILFGGRVVMTGGWPAAASPPWRPFKIEDAAAAEPSATLDEVRLRFEGAMVEGAQRVEFAETCLVRADNSFTLHFDFSAATDLNLRLWRHYFFLPVRAYAGATARTDGGSITLPEELGEESLLPGARRFEIEGRDLVITVDSSVPLSLIDHRRWGTPDYLLAGYPVSGRVKRGTTWSVDIAVAVRAPM